MGGGKAKYYLTYHMTKEQLRNKLYDWQEGLCDICRRPLPKRFATSLYVNIDHRKTRAHGGVDDVSNLGLTHKECNSRKGETCSPGVECMVCYPVLLPSLED